MRTRSQQLPVVSGKVSMKVLLKESGLSRQTVHFYLRRGLLPKPARTSRTYALYSSDAIELLKLIKECQNGLRLSLEEIFTLFSNAGHDPARIRRQLKTTANSSQPAQDAMKEPAPSAVPGEWIETLRRRGLLSSGTILSQPEQRLAAAAFDLTQSGFRIEDLKRWAAQIEKSIQTELSQFTARLDSRTLQDYSAVHRLLGTLRTFAEAKGQIVFAAGLLARNTESAGRFVGAAGRHVLPSETLLSKMGLNREIDRLLKKLDHRPHDVQVLVDLSRAYDLRSDWHSVYGVCERVLQFDPGNVRVIAQITRAMYHLGRGDEAIRMIENRLRVSEDPLLRFRLGQLEMRRGLSMPAAGLIQAILRREEYAAEALRSTRDPAIQRWIRLDIALDNLSVADPLRLNQPTIEELEDLVREYEAISDKDLSRLSRMRLLMGQLLANYALYLVYERARHKRTAELRRHILQIDPYGVLAHRTSQNRNFKAN